MNFFSVIVTLMEKHGQDLGKAISRADNILLSRNVAVKPRLTESIWLQQVFCFPLNVWEPKHFCIPYLRRQPQRLSAREPV